MIKMNIVFHKIYMQIIDLMLIKFLKKKDVVWLELKEEENFQENKYPHNRW